MIVPAGVKIWKFRDNDYSHPLNFFFREQILPTPKKLNCASSDLKYKFWSLAQTKKTNWSVVRSDISKLCFTPNRYSLTRGGEGDEEKI